MKFRILVAITTFGYLVAGHNAPANAIGCISGGLAGAVAGHMVHHGILGAIGGCIAGHQVNKRQRAAAQVPTGRPYQPNVTNGSYQPGDNGGQRYQPNGQPPGPTFKSDGQVN